MSSRWRSGESPDVKLWDSERARIDPGVFTFLTIIVCTYSSDNSGLLICILNSAVKRAEEKNNLAEPSDISTAAEPSNTSVDSSASAGGLSGDVQPCSSSAHSLTNAAANVAKVQKHASTFYPKWKIGHPWLIYDSASHSMFCKYCQDFYKMPFGRDKWNKTGCTEFIRQ